MTRTAAGITHKFPLGDPITLSLKSKGGCLLDNISERWGILVKTGHNFSNPLSSLKFADELKSKFKIKRLARRAKRCFFCMRKAGERKTNLQFRLAEEEQSLGRGNSTKRSSSVSQRLKKCSVSQTLCYDNDDTQS